MLHYKIHVILLLKYFIAVNKTFDQENSMLHNVKNNEGNSRNSKFLPTKIDSLFYYTGFEKHGKSISHVKSSSRSKYDQIINKEQKKNQDLLNEIRKLKKYNDMIFR